MIETKLLFKQNRRNRYFASLKGANFDGLIRDFCMHDSGSNSHLIPLKDGELSTLAQRYTTSDFFWKYSRSAAVGGMSATLSITSIYKHKFRVTFPLGGERTSVFELPRLRFVLNRDDVQELLSFRFPISFAATTLGQPITRDSIMNDIASIPTERRKHVLIGQDFTGGLFSLQADAVLLLFAIDDARDWASMADVLTQAMATATSNVETQFGSTEFNDLEDEGHHADEEVFLRRVNTDELADE